MTTERESAREREEREIATDIITDTHSVGAYHLRKLSRVWVESPQKLHPHSWREVVRSELENVGNGGSSVEGVVD